MLRSLLVGVSGSRGSCAACEIAITWGAALSIPVTCLGIVDLSALAGIQAFPPTDTGLAIACDPGLVDAERHRIKDALQSAANRAEQAGVGCRILTREGSPAVLLGEEAQRHDLLILGRGSCPGGNSNSAPSDVLVDILRYSPRSIILACEQIPKSSHVVVAYDGSVQAARTLQSFVSSGLYHGHALHVVGISDKADQMGQILGRATDFLAAHSLRAEMHLLPVGKGVAETLIEFTHRVPTGLLVLGAYGQAWYKELLFGSVTRSILAKCSVPLFLNH